MPKNAVALIVAAGESRRVGGDIPKQYQMLGDKSLLRRSVEAFLQHPGISAVKVVIRPNHHEFYAGHTQGLDLLPAIDGGSTRQESVRKGLQSLQESAPDYVLIHDAARPNISPELITHTLDMLETVPAVIPALPVIDTLKHVEDDKVVGTIERKKLFRAQTPQAFHYRAILEAHTQVSDCGYSDDAAVAENAGLEVVIIPGSEHNYKITTAEDMRDAQLLLENHYETRTGLGIDVHKFVASDKSHAHIMLCGVAVPHSHILEGHSDADVGLHALVDAMLGALGAGDIGLHFPPSDPKWKGADSAQFVQHAMALLAEHQAKLVHADITILCEKPHIQPHRAAMIARLAELLQVAPARISVKATTTEKLGFLGRAEGIAAQVIVTIKVPIA